MNILFLSHRIPYPPDKGDKIRSFNEIKYFSKRNKIYLGTILDQQSEDAYLNELEQYCKEVHAIYFNKKAKLLKSLFTGKAFSVSNFYDKSLQNYVDRTLKEKNIDAVICFCSSMAEYIFRNPLYKKAGLPNTKLIIDYVDLDSNKWLQYARYASPPLNLIYEIENKRLFKYEVKINRSFHHSIFISQREVEVFKKLYPKARNIHVIPNGVDYEYFSPYQSDINQQPETRNQKPILLFTGVMDYFANENGVKWFCKSIFPKIRAELPQAQFYIVGSRPTNMVRNLSGIDGVIVTGYVHDIRKYYWMADVCVTPLKIACGLQNKVLEAMATGNAVVATSNASGGIICHNNIDIAIADGEVSFANEVISLLKEPDRRKEMGKRAVENIRRHYSWEKNLKAFDDLLNLTTD
ncbi:MAG: TIGR03087 family PEP-CTERM/XrtA system glycosyltransferase [Proteobacteria bacterium]|nr:TIGR03087 family PEP-CTERM/XrtA system glycosyltransferase [Pseudomonadota bacterium]MBU4286584.1 TIGR03087 family PEP-CTERM/XrtA system glycosyltransferase [Pseudomonadota bacterium]MCG2758650.1 TIGR03087 family PEP-CTERM/XrtA system glycosyltransferase [Desulfobacteraceae bacterium]